MISAVYSAALATVQINLPGIKSIAIEEGWKKDNSLSKPYERAVFYDSKNNRRDIYNYLDIRYVKSESDKTNNALRKIFSEPLHSLSPREYRNLTGLWHVHNKLQTVEVNGKKLLCTGEPEKHEGCVKMAQGGYILTTYVYYMYEQVGDGFLSIEYGSTTPNDNEWSRLLRSIIWH